MSDILNKYIYLAYVILDVKPFYEKTALQNVFSIPQVFEIWV